jgi:hypothetical protein
MKKKLIFIFLISSLLISCTNIRKATEKLTLTNVQNETEVNPQPIPKFETITEHIKPSYRKVSWDEVRRKEYLRESTHLDPKMRDIILRGDIRVGMYKEDVLASIGGTDNKIKKITDFGIKEEWIYDDKILYFENGILKDIKNIEKNN